MGWKVHIPGADPKMDELVSRRFGPGFPKPCKRPNMIECALSLCQWNNECAYIPSEDEKYEVALENQRRNRKR